jgi:hypothetical protein
MHDWGFAEKTVDLAPISGVTPTGFTYAYSVPTDHVKTRRVYNPSSGAAPIDYILQVGDDLSSKEIWTDQSEARLIYTARVTNLNIYTPMSIVAFKFWLATSFVILTGDERLAKKMEEKFQRTFKAATGLDTRQQKDSRTVDNTLRTSRL